MGMRSSALLPLAAVLMLAPAAQGATVETRVVCPEILCVAVAHFTAAAGEANRLTVVVDGPHVRFTDAGARLEPAGDCRRLSGDTVECAAAEGNVRTGDGDDRVLTAVERYDGRSSSPVRVWGDDGGDVLIGGEQRDWMDGGAGDDELHGAGGGDELWAGGGADLVLGGAGDDSAHVADRVETGGVALLTPTMPDRVEGGPGSDSVTFAGDTRRVEVDLASAATGGTGGAAHGDAYTDVENLAGGFGEALFAGDAGPNRLVAGTEDSRLAGRGGDDDLLGQGGSDLLDGGDGDDALDGGAATNVVLGGPGADRIRARASGFVDAGDGDDRIDVEALPPEPLRIVCGAGEDVAGASLRVSAAGDCEWLALGRQGAELRSPLRLRGRTAFTTVRGPPGMRGRLVLRDRRTGRRLGAADWAVRGATTSIVRFALPRAVARRARRLGGIAVAITERGSTDLRAVSTLSVG
jgi:hypothetical protein